MPEACEVRPAHGARAIGAMTRTWLAEQERKVGHAPKRSRDQFQIADATVAQIRHAASLFSARALRRIEEGANPEQVRQELEGKLAHAAADAPRDAALMLRWGPVNATIRCVAAARTRGRNAAEDVVSDAVLGLLRGNRRLAGDIVSLPAYAAAITRHAATDAARSASAQEQAAVASRAEGVRRLRTSVDSTAAEAMSRTAMQRLCDRLEPDARDGSATARRKRAFVLYLIGVSTAEAARELGVSREQHRQDVARMRRALEDDSLLDELLPRKNASKASAGRCRQHAVVTALAHRSLPTSRRTATYLPGATAANPSERHRDAA